MKRFSSQSGNMLIYILGAIVLIGILIMVLRSNFQPGSGIDAEQAMLGASSIRSYANQLESGVNAVLGNGISENDISFAHFDAHANYGDPETAPERSQVFHPGGGGVEYASPPRQVNDGTAWQFYSTTHLPQIGTNTSSGQRAELIAVLPNVNENVCAAINASLGQKIDLAAAQDPSAGGCIHAGIANVFSGTFSSGAAANSLDNDSFTFLPVTEGCVRCQADNSLHYFRMLKAR